MEDTNILQRIVSFYADCYSKEKKGSSLNNFFTSQIQNRFFIEKEDQILNQFLPYYPISTQRATTFLGKLKLANEDIELIHASFFACGIGKSIGGHDFSICAPLVIHPATILHEKGNYYVKIDYSKRRLNLEPLNYLSEETLPYSQQKVDRFLEDSAFDFGQMSRFKQFIEAHFMGIETEQMLLFPHPAKERVIRYASEEYATSPNILFSSALGLTKKTKNSFGVEGDLRRIQNAETFSAPLRSLFDFPTPTTSKEIEGIIPAILNESQTKAIESLNNHPLSILSGPPGTGKSFTIATLAIEQLSKGKSTLIVAQNEQALDVISDKIKNHIGIPNVVIEGASKKDIAQLKRHLAFILGRTYVKLAKPSSELKSLYSEIQTKNRELSQLEEDFNATIEREINWVDFFQDNARVNRYVSSSFERYASFLTKRKNVNWELSDLMQVITEGSNSLKKQYIQDYYYHQLEETIRTKRKALRTFLNAIKSISKTKRKQLFSQIDFTHVFSAFPIWLVTADELSNVFPLQFEMFDTVIIDEASQCDIPSMIPALQRAKKAVIVGDTQQLRPVSFLSKLDEWHFLDKYNFTEAFTFELESRNKSILDLALETMNNDGVVFLNEHFRSVPSIIHFSNKNFYNQSLSIMSKRPDVDCEELIFHPVEGKRTPSGYNKEEADFILQKIRCIVLEERYLDKSLKHSIGILSPFRKQVDYLSGRIRRTFSLQDIDEHNIIVGTAHNFQGSERDIMYLSLSVDNLTPAGAFNFINRADVFNVSITRASKKQHIIHSFDPELLKEGSLLGQYFFQGKIGNTSSKTNQEYDAFMKSVVHYLDVAAIPHWPLYQYAGITIDILIKKKNRYIALDLIGHPGEVQGAFSIERYKTLYRCGIHPVPIPYSKWKFDSSSVLERLRAL